MANYSRKDLLADGSSFHIFWQCHNNDWLLKEDDAKELYLKLLGKYKDRYQVYIHSYSLMDSHPHISGTCTTQSELSDFMRVVNSCFAKKINKLLKRKGQVVMDRFKSVYVESDQQLLETLKYIELNPTRTVKSIHPKDYKWCSYAYYALGIPNNLITPAKCYLNLGANNHERQAKYQELIEEVIQNDPSLLRFIYQKGTRPFIAFLGNPHWVQSKLNQLKYDLKERRKKWKEKWQSNKQNHCQSTFGSITG